MKRIATITILAVMAMAAVSSCTKELNGAVDKAEGTVSFSVRAELPDYDADTKNTLVNTVRVKWEDGDSVYVYDNEKCLGILQASGTDTQGKVTYLSGDIEASQASYLTLAAMSDDIKPSVFEKGSTLTDGITFDLSNQALSGAPYVAYATVDKGSTSGISASFTFATAIERVNCTGLKASTAIDSIIIKGVNTQLKITPSTSGDPTVAAEEGKGTIIRKYGTGLSSVNAEGTTTFSAALLAQGASARRINVFQGNYVTEAKFTGGAALKSGKSYNTICQLSNYVEMKMGTDPNAYKLKWAKMNLGATTVAGNGETCYGDYYAWGEKAPYYVGTGGWPATPTWKSGKDDGYCWQSYCGSQSFSEWGTQPYDDTNILKPEFDAAAQTLGDGWRMPTSQEFKDLADACGGSSNYDKDTYKLPATCGEATTFSKGIYWCDSYDGVAGLLFCDGTNKLFFPAAGYGGGTGLANAGVYGNYWSSSLCSDDTDNAYDLFFDSNFVTPQGSDDLRFYGIPVRPVSD